MTFCWFRGPVKKIAGLKKGDEFLVLLATTDLPFARKAPIALLTMLDIVATAAPGILPIAVSAPCGALLMGILTNIVSNNAAAVIGTPITVSIAAQMGLPPEPYVLAVLFGANMGYATPMAYKTNLLVMNAGKYTFNDFLRVGVPLLLIMWVSLSWLLPVIYGLR